MIGTLPIGAAAASSSSNEAASGSKGNGGGNGGGFQGPKDIKDAPDNDPKPNFDGPDDFQMAP